MRARTFAIVAVLAAALAGPAAGGAWPREAGSWFASATVHLSWPRDLESWESSAPTARYDALYLEYGMTERLTLGLDLGRSVSGAVKTVAFVQFPVSPEAARVKVAAQLGFGVIDGQQVVRPGLLLGTAWRRGWLAADALVEQPIDGGAPDIKLDLTYGIHLREERKLLLQLQTGREAGDPAFLRLAPSLVTPWRGPLSLEIGGAVGLAGDDSVGLKLGLWAEF